MKCGLCDKEIGILEFSWYRGICGVCHKSKENESIITDEKPRYWLQITCHDCDTKVGDLHEPGCDMERCPICDPVDERQLITCGHYDEVINGGIARIPYIQPLVRCEVCNELMPDFFNVPDEEWDKHVIPVLQHQVLCRDCYDAMKQLFPNGWRNKERGVPSGIPLEEEDEILYADSYMTIWEDETPRDGIKVDHEGTEYGLIGFSTIEDDKGKLVLSYKIKEEKNQFLYYFHNDMIVCDMEEFFIRQEELEKTLENGAAKLEL